MKIRELAVLLAPILVLVACAGEDDVAVAEQELVRPAIYTVNYPLAWMAESLAGDAAEVHFPAPRGVDPAFWEPGVETILDYQQADLVLLNGANYARWIDKVSMVNENLRDTSLNYRDRFISVDAGPVHSHGPDGEHSHGELAFTTWLDLEQAQAQLQAVAVALAEVLPDEIAPRLAARESASTLVLAEIDRELAALGAALGGAPILYSHPVYQYLERRYRLNGRALHWEPGEMPDAAQWRELESLLQSHPAELMLWEGEPLPAVVAKLQLLGIEPVVFYPLGNRPSEGDFVSEMKANIGRLQGAL